MLRATRARALALVKSEFYYTSRVYYTSVLGTERKRIKTTAKKKERERLEKGCVHFTVVGVQKIYQGGTVSCIMTEMLVRCWKRAKRRERIAKLAGKCSFFLTRRKIKNTLWNQGS